MVSNYCLSCEHHATDHDPACTQTCLDPEWGDTYTCPCTVFEVDSD